MTIEEIKAMEPGPEMDYLIGTKVMGFKADIADLQSFNPSTEITSAWDVYEEILESHPYLELVHHTGEPGWYEPYYSLRNSSEELFYEDTDIEGEGKTPMEAICKFALIACLK